MRVLIAVYTELLFPYGTVNGDTTLPRGDDSYSSIIILTTSFAFFGRQQKRLYVNLEGLCFILCVREYNVRTYMYLLVYSLWLVLPYVCA